MIRPLNLALRHLLRECLRSQKLQSQDHECVLFNAQRCVDGILHWKRDGLFVPLLAERNIFIKVSNGVSQKRLHVLVAKKEVSKKTKAIPTSVVASFACMACGECDGRPASDAWSCGVMVLFQGGWKTNLLWRLGCDGRDLGNIMLHAKSRSSWQGLIPQVHSQDSHEEILG